MIPAIDEVVESNRQLALLYGTLAPRYPHPRLARYEGVECAWACIEWPFLNATWFTAPVADRADLERRIRFAVDHARGLPHRWMLACCEEWLPPEVRAVATEIFAWRGMREVVQLTGMAAEELAPTLYPVRDLEFRPVCDAATRRAIGEINAVSYGVPLEWGHEAADREAVWDGVFASVGYLDGQAVTCAATFLLEGVRYVAYVATLPEYRRRGYAEAVMRHSLDTAEQATGVRRSVLHASQMGRPVYETMGYRPVATFRYYMVQPA